MDGGRGPRRAPAAGETGERLPANDAADRVAPPAGRSRADGPETRKQRILVVDDEIDTLALTEAALTRRGYEVHLADSGARALEVLAPQVDAFDVVLLDVMMPRMSGLEVLAWLRATPRLAGVPVILLTARQRDRDLLEGYGRGADYYIPKPCTVEQIEYGLRLVLGGRAAPKSSGNRAESPQRSEEHNESSTAENAEGRRGGRKDGRTPSR